MFTRHLLASALLIAPLITTAQSKFYLKPSAGVGIGNLSQRSQTINKTTYDKTPAIHAGIAGGYRINRFDISAGFTYMRIGYRIGGITFNDIYNTADSGSITYYYNQILLPLLVGYDVPINSRFHFIPQTGLAFWYTINGSYELKSKRRDEKQTIPANSISQLGNSYGLYSVSHLNISYDVSPKLSVSVAPSLYYMVSTLSKYNVFVNSTAPQRLYSLTLDLGLTMNLGQ